MPIYEYECDGCQAIFEVRQRMSDPAPTGHACGSTSVHRVLSATSFVLKGTGWYATDYGNRSQPPPEGAEPKADSKGDAKADGKADAKATGEGKGGDKAASASGASEAKTSKAEAGGGKSSAPKAPAPKGGGSPAAA